MSGKKLAIPLFVGGLFLFIIVTSAGIVFVISAKNSAINNTSTTNTTNSVKNTTAASSSMPASVPVSSTTATTTIVPTTEVTSGYKDGTYTVDSSYYTPEDIASMKVSVKVSSGKISGLTITPEAFGESGRYQSRFASAVSGYVVGKTIENAALKVNVSGASLTTDAFNIALAKIAAQAKI